MDKQTVAVYNDRIADYMKLTKNDPDDALVEFMDYLPRQAHVLDLGCGPGTDAAMMKKAGLTVDAIDASAEMIRVANDSFDLGARVATFSEIDDVDRYDGIWANFSLLHATEDEFVAILPRLHCALKPAGLLFMGMKTGEGMARDRLGRRYTYYSEERLTNLLSATGFDKVASLPGEGEGLAGGMESFVLMTFRAKS